MLRAGRSGLGDLLLLCAATPGDSYANGRAYRWGRLSAKLGLVGAWRARKDPGSTRR